MGRFLNQAHLVEEFIEQQQLAALEYPNEPLPHIDPATVDIVMDIYRAAGRVLYYVSASNWLTYYAKIKSVVQVLGTIKDVNELSPPEIRMLESSCLTRQRLHMVLSELSPYFLPMERQGKLLFSKMMRKAIWRWIETYPAQFAEVSENQTRLLSGAEVLFDMCSSATDHISKKAVIWPLQTILLVLSPKFLLQAFLNNPNEPNRRSTFLGILRNALRTSRTADIAAVCYVDLCKAATYVPPTDESVLRHIVADIEDDLKDRVWDFSRSAASEVASPNPDFYIDLKNLATEYLLARMRLNPKNALTDLIPPCLEENVPITFKFALVKACLAITQDEDRLPWNPTISSMYDPLCTILRRLFLQTIGIELGATLKLDLSTILSGQRKNTKKETAAMAQSRIELLLDMLRLFKIDPLLALLASWFNDRVEQNTAFMTGVANLIQHPDQSVRHSAMECLAKLHTTSHISQWGPRNSNVVNFWRISSQIVFALARQILDSKQSEESPKSLLELLMKLLIARNDFLRKYQVQFAENDSRVLGSDVERLQAFVALEIALLVSLCSSDRHICSYAIKCLGYLCVEGELTVEEDEPQLNQITLLCNLPIYTDLADEDKVFIGRKAQQKSIRKYMRMITRHTPGNLAAWEEAWKRWKVLTQTVSPLTEGNFETSNDRKHGFANRQGGRNTSSPMSYMDSEEDKFIEWQNYTGFLAALGGCCLATDSDYSNDSGRSRPLDQAQMNARRISAPSEPSILADKFMKDMVDLLTCENVFIREGVKDTLGNDLSPALYAIMFRYLEDAMAKCFDSTGEAIYGVMSTVFVEQAVLVLKMILDRLAEPGDSLLNIDFSTLIHQFAKYLNKVPSNYVVLRIKIKICHLVEALMAKKDQIVIRTEIKLRNRLLEIIVEWTSDFSLQNSKSNVYQDVLQNDKLNRDLDHACLKAIVGLLQQLPLQPSENGRQGDPSQLKSRLFYKRIIIGTQSENYHEWAQLKEYTILAMSNLLSANIDAGLKYSLSMGYHEDVRTRTAFMQVLTNILNQGTEFETLAENVMTDRYEKLVDMVVGDELEIAMSLCDVSPSTEASEIAEILLMCFDTRQKTLPFLKALIKKEVDMTEQESTLFRGTTMPTRILSMYATMTCIDYIRITLQPAMEAINALGDSELTWELDPQKMGPDDDVYRNKKNIVNATELLLNAICSSVPNAPRAFRQELSLIGEAVRGRYPESKYMAVGGFVFLRLFAPAILSPEHAGFSKQALPRNKNVAKIQLQATRVMQNLANNVLFGGKETHMIVFNDFLTNNIYNVTNFLRMISTVTAEDEKQDQTNGIRMDQTSFSRIHRVLADNLERISRDLAGRKSSDQSNTFSILEKKKTIDKLTNLLGQLGRPSESSHSEQYIARNYALAKNNHYYSEFVRRNNHRDLASISSKNIFFQGGTSKGKNPVFYLITRNVDAETCDFELLVYYMLRVMEPYLNNPFELILDMTQFKATNEIPSSWMTQFFKLIFTEMNDYLVTVYVYNPNLQLTRYFNKLPRSLINKLVKRTRFILGLTELHEYITPSEVRLPKMTTDMEEEKSTVFFPVTKWVNLKSAVPVIVKVGKFYIHIITVRKQEILYNLNSQLKEVYHISEFEDMIATSSQGSENGGDMSIKYDHGKATMILSSPKRDSLLSLLRYKKQRYETSKPGGGNERAIRPSDVPGRLLNMALLNIGSDDPILRLSAYNLLYSLSLSFRFDIGNQLLNVKDLCIPTNSSDFIISISESLASTESHLTLEFINECFVGFNKSNDTMKQLCLDYMAPWLKNLSVMGRSISGEGAKNASKTKDVLRLLIEMTVKRVDMYKHIQAKVWKTLAQVDSMIDPILDEFVKYSVNHGVGSPQAESMADTFVTMTSVTVRGKVVSRLRKIIQYTSTDPCETLAKHPAWPEISVLLRFVLMLSFNNVGPVKPYLPEIFHIVSLLAATGSNFVRASVHELVVNVIHTLCTGMPIGEESMKKLHFLLNDVCESKNRVYFGLTKHHAKAFTITQDTMHELSETINLSSLENIARILLEVLNIGAPSTDVANMWRARWMGLVVSTAFQFNPAIQPRALVILGCLAQDEVDDDLIYQILVALQGAFTIFNSLDSSLMISIMMCLRNIIDNLPADSRYLLPLFWLAVALVQMSFPATFSTAVEFLQSVLRALDARKMFQNRGMVEVLLEARKPFADIAHELDVMSGVSFESHFSFAIAGILLKGIKNCDPKDIVFQCLTTFLEIDCKRSSEQYIVEARTLGYLAGLLPMAAKNNALRELLRLAGINDVDLDSIEFSSSYVRIFDTLEIPDNTTALLLVSLLVNMLNSADNEAERLFLYSFLAEAAIAIPEVFALVYESLLPKMNQMVVSSQNYAVIEAVKSILTTACSEPAFSQSMDRQSQRLYLEELGFPALSDPTLGAAKTNVAANAQLARVLLGRLTE
ncbi:hypothetical protein CLU79DRAFT_712957 [Phycomyces nitens]|nr:hypothetical protein CLU79DRAFT_712957 [Phycomyces nitens]